jgi:hypothetical protein
MNSLPKVKMPPAGPGIKKINKNTVQNTHHNKRDNTTLHKERPKTTT